MRREPSDLRLNGIHSDEANHDSSVKETISKQFQQKMHFRSEEEMSIMDYDGSPRKHRDIKIKITSPTYEEDTPIHSAQTFRNHPIDTNATIYSPQLMRQDSFEVGSRSSLSSYGTSSPTGVMLKSQKSPKGIFFSVSSHS